LKYRTMIFFELMINCRPAEMFALTWKKINFKTNEITINKAMKFTTSGFVVGLPKTGEKGERVVDMPVKLADMLQRLKKTSNSQFVFVDLEGRQLHKERFKYMWPKMVKALNLPERPNCYSLKTLGEQLRDGERSAPGDSSDTYGAYIGSDGA
jgi:integrase